MRQQSAVCFWPHAALVGAAAPCCLPGLAGSSVGDWRPPTVRSVGAKPPHVIQPLHASKGIQTQSMCLRKRSNMSVRRRQRNIMSAPETQLHVQPFVRATAPRRPPLASRRAGATMPGLAGSSAGDWRRPTVRSVGAKPPHGIQPLHTSKGMQTQSMCLRKRSRHESSQTSTQHYERT